MFTILTDEHPMLRKKLPVMDNIGEEQFELAKQMMEYVMKNPALGLAANQVGREDRLFVGLLEYDGKNYLRAFYNPEIVNFGDEEGLFEEGCLSVPEMYGTFKRPKVVKLRYQDEEGNEVEEEFSGKNSRIVQHETDHLNGILFTDYVEVYKGKKAEAVK